MAAARWPKIALRAGGGVGGALGAGAVDTAQPREPKARGQRFGAV